MKTAALHPLVMLLVMGFVMPVRAAEKMALPVEKPPGDEVGKALDAMKRSKPVDLSVMRRGLLYGEILEWGDCAWIPALPGTNAGPAM